MQSLKYLVLEVVLREVELHQIRKLNFVEYKFNVIGSDGCACERDRVSLMGEHFQEAASILSRFHGGNGILVVEVVGERNEGYEVNKGTYLRLRPRNEQIRVD